MTYVVTEPCLDCVFTECAEVCPTQAFHRAKDFLYINPTTCIDCDACVAECPVHAIYAENDVPSQWKSYIAKNKDECEKYPIIEQRMDLPKGPRCVDPGAN